MHHRTWETHTLFAWLISHQPAVLFFHNKPATSNQPAVLFSHNKPAPAISHQPTEQSAKGKLLFISCEGEAAFYQLTGTSKFNGSSRVPLQATQSKPRE
jgi:hypothetical protein